MNRSSQDRNYRAFWKKFIKEGSQEALSVIYFNHFDLLFTFGLKYTSDRQTIEDSIQNIFSYFLKVRKSLGPVNNIPGFLLKCFRRQLFIELKKQKKLLLTENFPEDHFNYSNSPEQDFIDHEEYDHLRTVVNQCITNLTVKQQEIIYLRFECELSYEDIANILEITVESCHKSVYRSINAIRIEAEKILCTRRKQILGFDTDLE